MLLALATLPLRVAENPDMLAAAAIDPGVAAPPGVLALAGTVEAVEDLGPGSRVRLLLDGPGWPARLAGFAAAGFGALQPGSRATAWFPADAFRPLPD